MLKYKKGKFMFTPSAFSKVRGWLLDRGINQQENSRIEAIKISVETVLKF
jgi:hypothetical protein